MLFENSEIDVVDELKIFSTPKTDKSIVSNEFVEYRPLHYINNTRPVDFRITGKENQYIDLKRSLLKVQFKLLLADGTSPAVAAKACVINNICHSLWKQDDIYLNNVLVSPSSNNYAYKAYFDTILKENSNNNREIEAALFYADTSAFMQNTSPTGANKGYNSRYEWVKEGKLATAISPLKSDLATIDKWLLPGVQIDIRLWQTSDDFRLLVDETETTLLNVYKIQLEDVIFLANIITVQPSVTLAHHQLLQTTNAKYTFERSRLMAFDLPDGSTSFIRDQLFECERPTRVIIGISKASGYNGDITTNPFHFSPYGEPSEIDLTVDDRSMNGRPFRFDGWSSNVVPNGIHDFAESFYQMHNSLKRSCPKGNSNPIQWSDTAPHNYRTGYCFFVFDEYAGLVLPPKTEQNIRRGNVKLHIKFSVELDEHYNLMVYGIFNDMFEIDKEKNIYLSK